MGSVYGRDGWCGAHGCWWGVEGAALGALERRVGRCGAGVGAAASICMWDCRGERSLRVVVPVVFVALGTARGGRKAVGTGEWGPRPAFEHTCHPSARFGIEGWVPCGCGGLPEACVLFVALFACSSGQRIGLQGLCVWCTKPPPAHARAPGTPPRAATRVVVTTIAIDMCIRWGRRSQKVFPCCRTKSAWARRHGQGGKRPAHVHRARRWTHIQHGHVHVQLQTHPNSRRRRRDS